MPILAGERNHELTASPINPENGHFSTKNVKKWPGKAKIQNSLYTNLNVAWLMSILYIMLGFHLAGWLGGVSLSKKIKALIGCWVIK